VRGVQRHGVSVGKTTGATGPQDLSGTLPEMRRQGSGHAIRATLDGSSYRIAVILASPFPAGSDRVGVVPVT
jgi:hypothetical protein